ncbi:MAG: preprotein translocase subunit SecE [Deltaproteobacteria bacterium]|nr:preprotein translocase subunit SecE [Deltaproteobacteria bacterium]
MSKVTNFLTEVVVELKKVTWPSSKDTWAATFVVIVFVVLVSAMLGAIDLGWAYLVKEIIIQR